jgi:hypothetical protein
MEEDEFTEFELNFLIVSLMLADHSLSLEDATKQAIEQLKEEKEEEHV